VFWRQPWQLIDYVRSYPNALEIYLSNVPAQGSAGPFYQKFGFIDMGEWNGNEKEMRLQLD